MTWMNLWKNTFTRFTRDEEERKITKYLNDRLCLLNLHTEKYPTPKESKTITPKVQKYRNSYMAV